jgi:hypothetical protein
MRSTPMARIAFVAIAAIGLQASAFQRDVVTAAEVPKTQITSTTALDRLNANKGVTLQWNWDAPPGELRVLARDGYLALKGGQRAASGGTLEIDGVVVKLDERIFTFRGRIVLHDAEAKVDCVRDGDYTFRITGARKYWRLKEQIAGCPGRADLTDYVDIFF